MNKDEYTRKYFHGLVAGSLQVIVVYPLDIMRIKFFLRRQIGSSFKHFYPALGFSLSTNILKQSLYYPTQDLVSTDPSIYGNLLVGLMLGLVTTPINAVKIPLQLQPQTGGRSWLQISKEIYNCHGFKGFFNGGAGTILRDTIWTVVYFGAFQMFQKKLETTPATTYVKTGRSKSSILLASILSCVFATTLAYPFDGARICKQQHHHTLDITHPDLRGFLRGFRESFAFNRHNLRSYASGVVRVTLATTLGHYTYLWLNSAT